MIFSLRFLIPVSAALILLLVVGLSYHFTSDLLREEVTQEVQRDMRNRINQAQGSIERFLKIDYADGMRQLMASFGSELDLVVSLVTEPEGQVVAATQHRLLQQQLDQIDYPIDPNIAQQVIANRASQVVLSKDGRWVQGYASICAQDSHRSLRATRCGLLYHQADLEYHLDSASARVRDQARLNGIGVLSLGLSLILLVHFRITHRIGLIQQALQAFSAGDRGVLVRLGGHDELAQISQGIDQMLTRLRRDEAELLESQQAKLAIINSTHLCIISTDAKGVISSINAVGEQMLGYSEAELLGRRSPLLFHLPEEIERCATQLSRELGRPIRPNFEVFIARLSQGAAEEQEWTYVRKDGSHFPVLLGISTLTDESGQVRGYLGVAKDISQRKRNEERLLLADKVFQNAGEGIVITDTLGIVVDVNPAYERITGYSKAEILGRSSGHVKSGRHDKAFYAKMWQTILQEGGWEGEIWDRRKSGEVFPKWLNITAIKDSQGQVGHYVGIFVDISQQKATEEKLQQLAFYDPLTRLPNRALFRDRLAFQINLGQRNKALLGLMFIDLDRFKQVNDSLGHDAGDELLIQVAGRIQACLRMSDTVARLGGDEFTLILPSLQSREDAAKLATKVIDQLQQTFDIQGHEVQIGASIGIGLHPQDGKDCETLIKHADQAMYQAKQQGRGCHRFYDQLTQTGSGKA
ncbi:MAG: diguanylate cyclase [Gammaproteobacteria bacterium SHHR-1]|uniref:diguanylate cyclase domain-containing protein n=1 Tax=Magnetovirga frankeli TaxID=947516 RepID=UPI001292D3C3|nr:diguanylate cyclase [gamma proteobacterium SS-5]